MYDDDEREWELMVGCASLTRWLAGISLLGLVLLTIGTCALRHL